MKKTYNDYKLNPLKIQLQTLFQTFYKKGITNCNLLDNKSKIELLDLYTKINQQISKKYTIETHFQTHYSQYTRELRQKEKKKTKSLKKKTQQKITAYNRQINQYQELKQQEKQEINNIKKEQIQEQKRVQEIKKEQISYIAQQGFLQEFANTDFYKKNTITILNQQAMVNNYLKKAFDANFEGYDKKFIISLMEKNNQLLTAIGIDKLMQLQPQALNLFLQQNNMDSQEVNITPGELEKIIQNNLKELN